MKEFIIQITPRGIMPHSEEDWDVLRGEYATNELIRCKSYHVGAKKEPSIIQGNLLHKCFQVVAENNDRPNMATKEQVKFACKMGIAFYHLDRCAVRPDGVVVFEPRSFAHDKLFGKERLVVIDKAFDWCASLIGKSVEELVAEAKSRMQRR